MSKVLKKESTVGSLSTKQQRIFKLRLEEINAFVDLNEGFRMEIASRIVALKEEIFGGPFNLSSYEEGFVIMHVSRRVDFGISTLRSWIRVFLSVRDCAKVASSRDYKKLSITERVQIAGEISRNKKKATTALKEHLANKDDPIKKKFFYLERYVSSALSTSRGLELAAHGKTLSPQQVAIMGDLVNQIELTKENLMRLLNN